MNNEQYNKAIKFFKEECGADDRTARRLATYADNICFNGRIENEIGIEIVLFGLRNAFFLGQENS